MKKSLYPLLRLYGSPVFLLTRGVADRYQDLGLAKASADGYLRLGKRGFAPWFFVGITAIVAAAPRNLSEIGIEPSFVIPARQPHLPIPNNLGQQTLVLKRRVNK